MIKAELISNLRSIIKECGLTQQQVGDLIGVSNRRINNILRGDCSEEMLENLINKLGYEISVEVTKIT